MPEASVAVATPSAPPPPAAGTPPAAPAESEALAPAQNTADQAPAAAPEGEKPDTDHQDPENKRQSRRFERRLDKAYKRAAEAEARATLYEKQLAEARTAQQPSQADPASPRIEQFDDIEKYAAAKAKYESEKALKDHTSKQHAEVRKQQEARLVEGWEEKTSRAEGKYPDFDEVVGELKPTTPWAVAIMEAENAEDVAYYLGKNLKEAQRISQLPPLSQVREIAKIEAKLLAEPPKPKTPSRAPAPITPLKGAAHAVNDAPSDSDDIGQWIRKRSKQVHKR